MAIEREHKYLVINDSYKTDASESHVIRQGYLNRQPSRTVRVRTFDNHGFITVKGKTEGDSRLEFEYEIPFADAIELLRLCEGKIIEKTRYCVPFGNHIWEVDEFHGDLAPLTVAEIELSSNDSGYALPPFAGKEVTGDPRYYNSAL